MAVCIECQFFQNAKMDGNAGTAKANLHRTVITRVKQRNYVRYRLYRVISSINTYSYVSTRSTLQDLIRRIKVTIFNSSTRLAKYFFSTSSQT